MARFTKPCALLLSMLCLCCASSIYAAHGDGAVEKHVDSPTFVELMRVATKLGMVRGMNKTWHSINRVSFNADVQQISSDPATTGTMRIEMNYVQNAVRSDISLLDGSGDAQRQITVRKNDIAWSESSPGVPIENSRELGNQVSATLYLSPHGFLTAALTAESREPGAVSVIQSESVDELAFSFHTALGLLTFTVNGEGLPQEVVIMQPGSAGAISATFAQYHDWELLDVPFPKHISVARGESSVAKIAVTEFRTNPYVVFPDPTWSPK